MLESPQLALYKETTKPNLQRMSDTNNAVFVDMIGISTAHPRHMAFYFWYAISSSLGFDYAFLHISLWQIYA